MSDSFTDKLRAKAQERGYGTQRMDFELHDMKVVEAGKAARLLATYSDMFGPPSVLDVQNWLKAKMGDLAPCVMARKDTITVYPTKSYVTFIVEHVPQRQPVSAKANMLQAGMDQFIDGEGNLWEIKSTDAGQSFLVRNDGVTVEKMLDLRKSALKGMTSMTRKAVRLASVDTLPVVSGGFADAEVGDIVDFYHNSLIHRGKLLSVTANGVKISSLTTKDTYTVAPEAIINVVEKSPAATKEQDDVMRKYFSLVYPANPEMVEKISPSSNKPIKDSRPKVEAGFRSGAVGGAPTAPVRAGLRVKGTVLPR
jgi:hypothetical protein